MIIRSVKPDEIEKLKELTPDDTSFYTEDIWYGQSKVCTNDEGEILGFALIKPHSLYDFFGGEIPLEEGVEERKKSWRKDDIETLKDCHYEVLFYMKNTKMCEESYEIYLTLFDSIENDEKIGILWSTKTIEFDWRFYHYNNIVYLWFSYLVE